MSRENDSWIRSALLAGFLKSQSISSKYRLHHYMKKLYMLSPLGGTRTDKNSLLMIEKHWICPLCRLFYRQKKNFLSQSDFTINSHDSPKLRSRFTSAESEWDTKRNREREKESVHYNITIP